MAISLLSKLINNKTIDIRLADQIIYENIDEIVD